VSLTSGLLHLAQLALTDIPHFAQEYVAIIFLPFLLSLSQLLGLIKAKAFKEYHP
jgi:hypothetical protein